MTVSSTTRLAGPFIGTGVSVPTFPFTFKVFLASDLLVVVNVAGVQTTLALTSDYTVALNADQDASPGGTISLNAASTTPAIVGGILPVAAAMVASSQVPQLQQTTLTNFGGFFPTVINAALDRLTILVQQVQQLLGRGITAPITDTQGLNYQLPAAAQRANMYAAFDGSGNIIATPGAASGVLVSAAMTPVVQAATLGLARKSLNAGMVGNVTDDGSGNLNVGAITNAGLAAMAANTVKANATAGSSVPTDVAVAANQLLGRAASGNITALSLLNMAFRNTTFLTPVIYSHCAGFIATSQTFASNISASMNISAGQATDSTNVALLTGAAQTWNIANGNAVNGYQGGTTLPNSATIHFFEIATPTDTTFTGCFASTSLTPTLPGAYVGGLYRRVFSLNTNSSGLLLAGAMLETGGGAVTYWLSTPLLDISTAALGNASRTLFTLTVPAGIRVQPFLRYMTNTGNIGISVSSGDEPDVLPTLSTSQFNTAPGSDVWESGTGAFQAGGGAVLTTNTSGQVGGRAQSGTTNTLYAINKGFNDFRRV